MMDTDATLVRNVFKEECGKYTITVMLTRFGDLAVFVFDAEMQMLWQGGNVIAARQWVEEQGP